MIRRLLGVAIDARVAARSDDPRQLAQAAGWIAANALGARGIYVTLDGPRPRQGSVIHLRTLDLTTTLAAIAAVPALLDITALPRSWVVAARVLGMPILDRPAAVALARGASVASVVAGSTPHYSLSVSTEFSVQIAHEERLLAA